MNKYPQYPQNSTFFSEYNFQDLNFILVKEIICDLKKSQWLLTIRLTCYVTGKRMNSTYKSKHTEQQKNWIANALDSDRFL